jgi:predicted GNAT superfamily acetyltransferase
LPRSWPALEVRQLRRETVPVLLRELVTLDDFARIGPLCVRTWGAIDLPVHPDLLLAQSHEGALVAGAFDDGALVGFVFGFPTSDAAAQHSHLLAVDPSIRGTGLGRQLKLFQRDWCLGRGITTVRWTYDPARMVNARLNIERLGARGIRYLRDYYGTMGGINAGAPSDRLLVSWNLLAPPGQESVSGDVVWVDLPDDFGALLTTDPAAAAAWRDRHRSDMEQRLDNGWQVVAMARHNGVAQYALQSAG